MFEEDVDDNDDDFFLFIIWLFKQHCFAFLVSGMYSSSMCGIPNPLPRMKRLSLIIITGKILTVL